MRFHHIVRFFLSFLALSAASATNTRSPSRSATYTTSILPIFSANLEPWDLNEISNLPPVVTAFTSSGVTPKSCAILDPKKKANSSDINRCYAEDAYFKAWSAKARPESLAKAIQRNKTFHDDKQKMWRAFSKLIGNTQKDLVKKIHDQIMELYRVQLSLKTILNGDPVSCVELADYVIAQQLMSNSEAQLTRIKLNSKARGIAHEAVLSNTHKQKNRLTNLKSQNEIQKFYADRQNSIFIDLWTQDSVIAQPLSDIINDTDSFFSKNALLDEITLNEISNDLDVDEITHPKTKALLKKEHKKILVEIAQLFKEIGNSQENTAKVVTSSQASHKDEADFMAPPVASKYLKPWILGPSNPITNLPPGISLGVERTEFHQLAPISCVQGVQEMSDNLLQLEKCEQEFKLVREWDAIHYSNSKEQKKITQAELAAWISKESQLIIDLAIAGQNSGTKKQSELMQKIFQQITELYKIQQDLQLILNGSPVSCVEQASYASAQQLLHNPRAHILKFCVSQVSSNIYHTAVLISQEKPKKWRLDLTNKVEIKEFYDNHQNSTLIDLWTHESIIAQPFKDVINTSSSVFFRDANIDHLSSYEISNDLEFKKITDIRVRRAIKSLHKTVFDEITRLFNAIVAKQENREDVSPTVSLRP